MDKFSWLPYPNISGRFACRYFCKSEKVPNGERVVGYVHEERAFGFSGGGVGSAKKFICVLAISKFLPLRNEAADLVGYDPVQFGWFNPKEIRGIKEVLPGVDAWASKNCGC